MRLLEQDRLVATIAPFRQVAGRIAVTSVLVGATKIEENAAAVNITLTPAEVGSLDALVQYLEGTRYADMVWVNR